MAINELILSCLMWDGDLDWDSGHRFIVSKGMDKHISEHLDTFRRAIEDGHKEITLLHAAHVNVLLTAGDATWGSRGMFHVVSVLQEAGVLKPVGFGKVVDWKKVVIKILEHDSLAPLLMGIDPALDDLLEEGLGK